jgi:hypothetical protein
MPSEDRKAFLLRIDPKLWAEIEALAADELRSVNGQIEFLLRQAVQQRRRRPAGDTGRRTQDTGRHLDTENTEDTGKHRSQPEA